MSRSHNFLILLGFISCLFFACEKEIEPERDANIRVTIGLIESDSYAIFEKYVLIYEDSIYMVKSPLIYFVSDVSDFMSLDYETYLTTLDQIIFDGENRDSLNASDYFNERKMDYLLALILENGQCHIKDKESDASILDTVMEKWSYYCGPLCGAGGRRFYISDELFLEITDWISK